MAKKESLMVFGKRVVTYGGGGALLVYGASKVTQGTSWSPAVRGGVAGGAMFAAGFGAASKGHPEIGAVLGIAGVISAMAGVAYQQDVRGLLAQSDAERTAALAAAAGSQPAANPPAAPNPPAMGSQPAAQPGGYVGPGQTGVSFNEGAPVVRYI